MVVEALDPRLPQASLEAVTKFMADNRALALDRLVGGD